MLDRLFEKQKIVNEKEPSQEELLEQSKKSLLEKMENDLEKIIPNLMDVCEKTRSEKPNTIIFLDKSARIFAGPVKKYLRDISEGTEAEESLPEFYFYNDENINHAVSNYNENTFGAQISAEVEKKIANEFKSLIGKKVFVVDETYSAGRTLRMWTEIARILSKIDSQTKIHFFALTRDDKYDNHSNNEHKEFEEFEEENGSEIFAPGEVEFRHEALARAKQEPNFEFTIYSTTESQVFSRYKDFQYVKDNHSNGSVSTEGINAQINNRKKGIKTNSIPFASNIEEQEVWNSHAFEMAKIAKQMTYEKMKEFSERQS